MGLSTTTTNTTTKTAMATTKTAMTGPRAPINAAHRRRRLGRAGLAAVAATLAVFAASPASAAPGDSASDTTTSDSAAPAPAATGSAATGSSIAPGIVAPAGGVIRDPGTRTVVADSYVVLLKPDARSVDGSATDLARRYSGRVGRTYAAALRGFQVSMSEADAKRLAADPAVAYVQRNGVYHMTGTQANPSSWGLDRIDQSTLPLDNVYSYPTTASNVHAYIIDTGIRLSHNTFGGRATSGFDAVDGGSADDCQGHGTHVAGTVGGSDYGVAKGVSLVAVRVLNCSGDGTTDQVVAGIDWVTANAIKPAVANMSLGGSGDLVLDAAVSASIASGVTYGVAAGNGNGNGVAQDACAQSPARVPAAITVSATNASDARASWANYGSCVDIFAPGVGIVSAGIASDSATLTLSGTSMATPHVVGAAALILADNPTYTPAQVRDALVGEASTGVVANAGVGSPNRLLDVAGGASDACTGTSGTDVSIPDAGAPVYSSITISGCGYGTALLAKVEVHIVHTYRGDLRIDLVAPDGWTYNLKAPSGTDGAANVDTTYTTILTLEPTNGTWYLKVQDMYAADSGYLNSWTLTL